jgi:uncharacterized protein (DUF2252 family)
MSSHPADSTKPTGLSLPDPAAFASLRSRPISRSDRIAVGRRLREQVPRSALGDWTPPTGRPDIVAQIMDSHQGRVKRLIPIRVARMAASPYGFLRGAAVVMAEDLGRLPATGIQPVICGDAHLGNFGFYASPEQDLVIDLNDFDEAHPGGWEWDLRRLAASVWVAGRQNNLTERECGTAVTALSATYRHHVRWLAQQPLLIRTYDRLDLDRLRATAADEKLLAEIDRASARARHRVSDRALPRFTETGTKGRRIVEEPPLITRVNDEEADQLAAALDDYLATLSPQWRQVLGGYTIVDIAHKVVGVGSVGLRAYVVLCEGSSNEDVVFLQLKEARRSVIARYVHGDTAWHAHQGQRVVEYQQRLQTVSDPLLGWTTVAGRQYYVRQFRNMKGSIALDALGRDALTDYVGICGRLLAKGHARTTGASMIAGYVGKSDKLDRAMCRFARAYADQTERDHQRLLQAVARGLLPIESRD